MRRNQKEYLAELRDQLEKQLNQVNRLSENPVEKLEAKRADGGWSVAECLHHMHQTYGLYRPRIDAHIPNLIANKNGMVRSSWFGRSSVKNTGPDANQRIKMKMKTFSFFEPQDGIAFSEARSLFEADLKWHLNVIEACDDKNICSPRVKSAIKFLRFRLGDALAFLLAHNARHILQAERNLS